MYLTYKGYIWYHLYSKYERYKMYKVGELRTKLREALNDADHGKEVIITRYGQRYKLVCLVGDDEDLIGSTSEFEEVPKVSTKDIDIIKTPKDAEAVVNKVIPKKWEGLENESLKKLDFAPLPKSYSARKRK